MGEAGDGEDDRAVRDAAQQAADIIARLEQLLSKFLPESDVSLLNTLGARQAVRVGDDLLAILRLARTAWNLTGGAFDPTVGSLVAAWGFPTGQPRVPPPAEIARLLEVTGMDHVVVDESSRTARFDRPGVSIDLGAIGKGYAMDLIRDRLRALGVTRGALLSGRSTIVTWGLPKGERRWNVEIVDPEEPKESFCSLEMEPGVLSTSGPYERTMRLGGREVGHVLDPRTGHPVEEVRSATAWTDSAALGDVLSTTLLILGPEALAAGGAVPSLLERWGGEPRERASILLLQRDPSQWGGLRKVTWHAAAPAFAELSP